MAKAISIKFDRFEDPTRQVPERGIGQMAMLERFGSIPSSVFVGISMKIHGDLRVTCSI